MKEFDGLTVANSALQQRYGGEVIRHARDEKLYVFSPGLREKSRQKFGIAQERKVVLFFGTPRGHKGLVKTAKAIATLRNLEILFVIVGDFHSTVTSRIPWLKEKLQAISGCGLCILWESAN